MPLVEIPDKQMVVEFPNTMTAGEIEKAILADVYGQKEAPVKDSFDMGGSTDARRAERVQEPELSPAISTITNKPIPTAEEKFRASDFITSAPATAAGITASIPTGIAAGYVGLLRLATTGDLDKTKAMMDEINAQPGKFIKTPEQQRVVENISQALMYLPEKGKEVMGKIADAELKRLSPEYQKRLGAVKPIMETAGEFGVLAAFPLLKKAVGKSTWYRMLSNQERGLVIQSLDDVLRNNPNMTEGEILRKWDNPNFKREALARRMKTEQETPVPQAETTPQAISKPTGLPISDLQKAIAKQAISETLAQNGLTPETFLQIANRTESLARKSSLETLPSEASAESSETSGQAPEVKPAVEDVKPEAKEPWQMTREEAGRDQRFRLGGNMGNTVARVETDGKIALSDSFFEHSIEDRKNIIEHEQAHPVSALTPASADKFWKLVDSGVLGKFNEKTMKWEGITSGRNPEETLTQLIADAKQGKPVPKEILEAYPDLAPAPMKPEGKAEAALIEEAKKHKTAEDFVEAKIGDDELYDFANRMGKEYDVFIHGGSEKIINEIRKGGDRNIFDGIFVSAGTTSSHGKYDHPFIINTEKIAGHGDIDLDYKKSIEYLKSEYPDMDKENIDRLYEMAVEDKTINRDKSFEENSNPLKEHGFRDISDAEWEAQRLRGQIALNQGYDAIAVNDEHGTSYLIPAGSKAINYRKQLTDIWNAIPTAPKPDKPTSPNAPKQEIASGEGTAKAQDTLTEEIKTLSRMAQDFTGTTGEERGTQGGDIAHKIGSSNPEWFQLLNERIRSKKNKDIKGISRENFNTILKNLQNGKRLTPKQSQIYDFMKSAIPDYLKTSGEDRFDSDLNFMQEKGYEILGGEKIVAGDLNKGDKVYMNSDEYEVKGEKDGEILLEDGIPVKVDPFDTLTVDGIKKAENKAANIRSEIINKIEKDALNLSKTDEFSAIPIKEYNLTTAEQQELVSRGMSFDVDRMGKPLVRVSKEKRIQDLRDKVTGRIETLPDGSTVNWNKVETKEKDGLKGTYYAVYNKDGSFNKWHTKTEIERLKSLKGVEGLNLKQDNYGKQTEIKGKTTGKQAGLGLEVEDKNQPGMFKKDGLSKLAETEAVKEQKGEVGLDINQEPEAKTSFAPEIEQAYQSAKGVKQEGIVSKIKEIATEISNKFTRTYESLAESGENSQLIFDLKKLEKQKEVAADKTVRTVGEVLSELNLQEYDVFSRKLFLDDLYDDLKRELYQDKDMPFNFTDKSLIAEKKKIDKAANANPKILNAIEKRKAAWEQVKTEYISALKPYKEGVEDMFRENYYRHQVLDYVTNQGIFGTGKRIKAPVNKGYTKGRKGVSNLYNTDFFEAEHNIMAQMLYDIEVAKTLTGIKKLEDISDKLKAEAKKQDIEDWKSLIPEGYIEWQPREGQVFYPVMSVNEKLAEKLATDQIGNLVGAEIAAQLKEVLAVGGKRKQWIVREEVADTLSNLVKDRGEGIISQADLQIMSSWKKWQLISPRRAFKYNMRNLSGDSEATFLGNPAGFKKIGQATKELYEVFYGKKPLTPEMEEWFNRGGMGSTLQAQEMDQVKKLWIFKRLYKKDADINILKKAWDTVRLATDFRESILRYANYLSFKEQLAKNGKVTNYGASNPEMIDTLSDPDDKAFWLSNDLLGAYDKVSVAGQTIRERMIPFWSWQEVNFKRYVRLFKNAANDGKLTSAIGKKLGAKGLLTAMRIGRFALKAAAFAAMLQAWNYLFFKKEEEELPRDVRTRTHIILGKDKDGNINYFNRLGTLDDFVSWFGLDFVPKNTVDLMNGRQTWQEAAKDQATKTYQAPINKVVQGSAPFMKLAGELITRRSTFPDTFKPGTVRDRGLHVARSVGLENEYIAMTGKPSKGYGESLKNLFVYRIDPGEAAYRNTIDLKMSFMKKQGKVSEGFWLTPSGDTLYNMKLAVRYNDKEAFGKYLKEYIALNQGKSLSDIAKKASDGIKRMHPLNGLSANEQAAFIATSNKEDKKNIEKAIKFYYDVLSKMGTQEKKP